VTQVILQDRTARRTVKAAGIVQRQECEPLDNGGWIVRDVQTGSGAPHIVVNGRCDCQDHQRRAAYCKHLQAVALEERSLAQYCDDWNARSTEARAISEPFADSFLDGDFAGFDDVGLTDSAGPRCPDCGAELVCRSYYVGGRGMLAFLCCTRDAEHQALPA